MCTNHETKSRQGDKDLTSRVLCGGCWETKAALRMVKDIFGEMSIWGSVLINKNIFILELRLDSLQ